MRKTRRKVFRKKRGKTKRRYSKVNRRYKRRTLKGRRRRGGGTTEEELVICKRELGQCLLRGRKEPDALYPGFTEAGHQAWLAKQKAAAIEWQNSTAHTERAPILRV